MAEGVRFELTALSEASHIPNSIGNNSGTDSVGTLPPRLGSLFRAGLGSAKPLLQIFGDWRREMRSIRDRIAGEDRGCRSSWRELWAMKRPWIGQGWTDY